MVTGDVIERRFFHWATQEFLDAANRAPTVEFTTSPTASWYWKGKLNSRDWVEPKPPLGQLGELLLHGRYSAEILKEYVFEEVRLLEFPLRPSRRRSMFLFDASLDPDAYAASMSLRKHHLFEVELLSGTVHRAATAELSCNLSLVPEIAERARGYWRHALEPTIGAEILFEGECRMRWVRLGAASGA
jgi:hypothetical protein